MDMMNYVYINDIEAKLQVPGSGTSLYIYKLVLLYFYVKFSFYGLIEIEIEG